jgi:hypothetical protein
VCQQPGYEPTHGHEEEQSTTLLRRLTHTNATTSASASATFGGFKLNIAELFKIIHPDDDDKDLG